MYVGCWTFREGSILFSDVPKYLFLNGVRIYFPLASTFGFGDLKIFVKLPFAVIFHDLGFPLTRSQRLTGPEICRVSLASWKPRRGDGVAPV